MPIEWAESFGNQGGALMRLADRRNGAALAETALRQIETAWDVARDGGNLASAAHFEALIPKARAEAARLRS